MLKIDEKKFSGLSYITCDPVSGVWVWQFKPVLEDVNGNTQWVTPKDLRNNKINTKFEKANDAILAILLNVNRSDNNEISGILNGTRIFKIILEETDLENDDQI